jgi:hypothetical protein
LLRSVEQYMQDDGGQMRYVAELHITYGCAA